jgi:Zn-finger protein
MFFGGNIHDLMSLEGEPHEWKIKDRQQETLPVVPCLACHLIHTENAASERYVWLADSSRKQPVRNPKTAFYVRTDKIHLRSDKLTKVSMISRDGKAIDNASDPNTLLCQQCHAPDYLHRADSEDDRTPTGIHEGISCIACHKPHSGNTRESCAQCHPSLTEKQRQQVYDNPHGY